MTSYKRIPSQRSCQLFRAPHPITTGLLRRIAKIAVFSSLIGVAGAFAPLASASRNRTAASISILGRAGRTMAFVPTTSTGVGLRTASNGPSTGVGLSPSMSLPSPKRTSSSLSSSSAPLSDFRRSFDHSWIERLSEEDPENRERSVSQYARGHPGRPIFNGHYVRVRPTPLKKPTVVICNARLAAELGMTEADTNSPAFVKYFSGDVDGAFDDDDDDDDDDNKRNPIETWATPYALSIMGKRYTSNCPYGTGDGYGDGRALSVAEIVVDNEDQQPASNRHELQLKGAGQTPFCRGADGRAVLRSSIREFLASEAMNSLGVETTRALCVIVSDGSGTTGDTSARAWYSDDAKRAAATGRGALPTMDDPRLKNYTPNERRDILAKLAAQNRDDPDTMVEERCAITTRVATSFLRIGHVDLFARRVDEWKMKNSDASPKQVSESLPYKELEELFWHACFREYKTNAHDPFVESNDAVPAARALLNGAAVKIADMVAGWVRVGFVQGNFNADNCLIGGRTMDYGPFGFLDSYHPLAAKWTGSGEHFGFMNQPGAGYANFAVLVESVLPVVEVHGGNAEAFREEILKKAQITFQDSLTKAVRAKMGLDVGGADDSDDASSAIVEEAEELWGTLEPILRLARADWTLFWRQLSYVAEEHFTPQDADEATTLPPDHGSMMLDTLLGNDPSHPSMLPFYDDPTPEQRTVLLEWIERWHLMLVKAHRAECKNNAPPPPLPHERMRLANPKYVLREWMLVEAYAKADPPGKKKKNPFGPSSTSAPPDYSGVHELYDLIEDPYGEGTAAQHEKYYRRASDASLRAGGTAFMS